MCIDTRLKNNNLSDLLIRDMRWEVTTAGPSPFNNKRTELFLLGCKKAMNGDACKGCFNSSTWDSSKAEFGHDPTLVAGIINKHAPNKYITIGGGEPTDQLENLIVLCSELKKYDFHIILYTWRELNKIFNKVNYSSSNDCNKKYEIDSKKIKELLNYIDIVIDGEYIEEENMYDFKANDGFLSSIGSTNQIVWSKNEEFSFIGMSMKNIVKLNLNNKNQLEYDIKEDNVPYFKINIREE